MTGIHSGDSVQPCDSVHINAVLDLIPAVEIKLSVITDGCSIFCFLFVFVFFVFRDAHRRCHGDESRRVPGAAARRRHRILLSTSPVDLQPEVSAGLDTQ